MNEDYDEDEIEIETQDISSVMNQGREEDLEAPTHRATKTISKINTVGGAGGASTLLKRTILIPSMSSTVSGAE
jgi:hypothetical protein